jgi:hypothetical protein
VCTVLTPFSGGFAVPLEIAFETDMVQAMCTSEPPYGSMSLRGECAPYLQWFWLNFVVDAFFMVARPRLTLHP